MGLVTEVQPSFKEFLRALKNSKVQSLSVLYLYIIIWYVICWIVFGPRQGPCRTFPWPIPLVCQWCCFDFDCLSAWLCQSWHFVSDWRKAAGLTWEVNSKQQTDGLTAKFASAEIHIDNVTIWQVIRQSWPWLFWPLPWILSRIDREIAGQKGTLCLRYQCRFLTADSNLSNL